MREKSYATFKTRDEKNAEDLNVSVNDQKKETKEENKLFKVLNKNRNGNTRRRRVK